MDSINPYAPTTLSEDADETTRARDPSAETEVRPFSLIRSAIIWTVVCAVSAAPSFVFGAAITQGFVGMLTGIAMFIAFYVAADHATYHRPFRRHTMIRRVLKITYGTRIFISVVFPIGVYVDLICGMISLPLGTMTFDLEEVSRNGSDFSFLAVLVTTLIQGVMLNLVLGVYAAILLGLGYLIRALRS